MDIHSGLSLRFLSVCLAQSKGLECIVEQFRQHLGLHKATINFDLVLNEVDHEEY